MFLKRVTHTFSSLFICFFSILLAANVASAHEIKSTPDRNLNTDGLVGFWSSIASLEYEGTEIREYYLIHARDDRNVTRIERIHYDTSDRTWWRTWQGLNYVETYNLGVNVIAESKYRLPNQEDVPIDMFFSLYTVSKDRRDILTIHFDLEHPFFPSQRLEINNVFERAGTIYDWREIIAERHGVEFK